ncbi:MAG: DUF305 domain-containing protein, partial [Gammaproteobacteria bacterium]|nr:DUF305 domain-containing protein [Gammaproteobacteria bacterium]
MARTSSSPRLRPRASRSKLARSVPDLVAGPARGVCTVSLLSAAAASLAQAPIVQPGAPGEQARLLSAEAAIELADSTYTRADVQFLQDMIVHHRQAIDMAALVADRTNRQELRDVAARIDASQDDEIAFMQSWLSERGEDVPEPTARGAMRTSHRMAGIASPEQMAALAASTATQFDRLFLELMIAHHEGAVTMVEALLEQPGSAYEPGLFEFTTDVTNDQTAEIERMNALLVGISADPRAGLKAGFDDAGQAIMNMELVASLPKPPGFYDPANPAGLPPKRLAELADKAPKDAGPDARADNEGNEENVGRHDEHEHDDNDGNDETERTDEIERTGEADGNVETGGDDDNAGGGDRSPLLSFANTDMAFRDDVMVVGSYHGFNVYRLGEDGVPELTASIVCPGGQGDVSIVGNLLIMSVEQTRGRIDCGLDGVGDEESAERFRGLRIFDISDLTRPVQVGQVQTCRGSHTHSVVSARDGRIVVYNSGTSTVRDEEELEGCIGDVPGDTRTALFRIDVVEIPVDEPSKASIVDSPAVFADPETGILGGLWRGGDHGDDTQETRATDQCHDITVFPELEIAAGACSGNGILFDIADPLHPARIDAVVDPGFAYWHSATFNNEGTKVVFTDEWGGGTRPRCRAHDPLDWGADAIYDIVGGKLEFRSHYKMPAPQVDAENCVAHNGSIVPVPGRDIMVQSWYQGGISVVDFTDSANPVEIAYFDRGPVDEEELIVGGYWSSYWYRGKVYATEIVRGVDVFSLAPSDFLSENEIAAAAVADQGRILNPQQQFRVTWPAEPVVARAYVDQLQRSGGL